MTATAFAGWLRDHSHEDIVVHEDRITSMLNGKRRAYELVPAVMSPGTVLDGDIERAAYWKRVAP